MRRWEQARSAYMNQKYVPIHLAIVQFASVVWGGGGLTPYTRYTLKCYITTNCLRYTAKLPIDPDLEKVYK